MDFISEVMEADQRVIDDLRVLQAQIAEKQQTLETSLAEQQSAKEALAVKNNELRRSAHRGDRSHQGNGGERGGL